MVRTSSILLTITLLTGLHVQASADVLGTAKNFVVLAGSAVTNTGSSVVTGELGVWPGSAVSGFPPGLVTGGTIHIADAVAMQAQSDLTSAYNALTGLTPTQDLSGQDLGGLTLTPGVYFFSTSAQLTGTLLLDTQGDPTALFVFQIASTLTTASGSMVATVNDVDDCEVYWQVGSSATLGTGTSFQGNILALASITMSTGSSIIDGRALARNGAVTIDTVQAVAGCTCVLGPTGQDCNANGVPDECDITGGTSLDCNRNGIPDECDLPGSLPHFTSCDETPFASVGVEITFDVCAVAGGPGVPVTVSLLNGLPFGATLSPALPTTGDTVCTTFTWVPTIDQTGAHVLEFWLTDANGCTSGCKMRILVARTLMLFGPGPGSSPFTSFGHLFDTQLSQVRRAFPVSEQRVPSVRYDLLPPSYSVQVVMHSPLLFQANPSQWSYTTQFTKVVQTQSMLSQDFGTMNGIEVDVQTYTDANNQVQVTFPIDVLGL